VSEDAGHHDRGGPPGPLAGRASHTEPGAPDGGPAYALTRRPPSGCCDPSSCASQTASARGVQSCG
jgi:hypothetical protein